MADSGQEVGEWIAAQLANQSMTPAQLARESGVARSTIDELIKGKRRADDETYKSLAEILTPGQVLPLRQVVGGPRILADATTPRQALSIARRAIDKAEKLLGPNPNARADRPVVSPAAAETSLIEAVTEALETPDDEGSKAS